MMKTENSIIQQLNAMCRLCTTQCDDENSVEIFDSSEHSLIIRIMACAGLEVCFLFYSSLSVHFSFTSKKKTKYNQNNNM